MPKYQRRLRSRLARTGGRDESEGLAAAAAPAAPADEEEEVPDLRPRTLPKVMVVTAEEQAAADAALQKGDTKRAFLMALEEKRKRKRRAFRDSLLCSLPPPPPFQDCSLMRLLLLFSQACRSWTPRHKRRKKHKKLPQPTFLLLLVGTGRNKDGKQGGRTRGAQRSI